MLDQSHRQVEKQLPGDANSLSRWLIGILVGFVLSALGGLGSVAMRHEGAIGRWDGRLEAIQHVLERIENKLDGASRK